ncbi:MAG: GTPase Era [Thermodesulfobacteriota bacterium]
MPETPDHPFRCGMVAIVGPPNAGKSTLLNSLLGEKIAIVTPKPQTTRNRVAGIVNGPDYQIVFLDTPGLHPARSPLNQAMVHVALDTLAAVDAILFLVDVSLPLPPEAQRPDRLLPAGPTPAILVLNKIDLVARATLLPLMETYSRTYPFAALIPVSALHADGLERILAELLPLLPPGPALYPPDVPTDASERFLVGEIIREKVFLATEQEVPYASAVVIDRFKDEPERDLTVIDATVIVERSSQKGIIIGKGGSHLKEIGRLARRDIESLLGRRVYLHLWVKVMPHWTRDKGFLRELGM